MIEVVEVIALTLILVTVAVVLSVRGGPRRYRLRHEIDIRLPYKKYRELYPSSTLTYREYKKMQAREAFKTSVPSKQHNRMVR